MPRLIIRRNSLLLPDRRARYWFPFLFLRLLLWLLFVVFIANKLLGRKRRYKWKRKRRPGRIYSCSFTYKIYRWFETRFQRIHLFQKGQNTVLGKSFRRIPLYPWGGSVVSLIRMIVSSDPWNGTSSTDLWLPSRSCPSLRPCPPLHPSLPPFLYTLSRLVTSVINRPTSHAPD